MLEFLNEVDAFVWGPPLLCLLVGTGIWLTIRLNMIQVLRLPLALKLIFKAKNEGHGDVDSFKALCTALAATVGTGNIVGVATAIKAGGPGALFWMWMAAFFGMATKYAEGVLAVKYRTIDANGHIGGLGIMTMTTLVMVIAGRKVSLRERLFLQESMNQTEISGVVRIALNIIKYTLVIEFFFGTILAAHFAFVKDMGWIGVVYGYWHSVSAFCNAGFDLMGDYKSLVDYHGDIVINLSIALLITLGGLGFMVLEDLKRGWNWERFSLHTKIVLLTSVGLNVVGTLLLWGFESNNPYTLGNMSMFDS